MGEGTVEDAVISSQVHYETDEEEFSQAAPTLFSALEQVQGPSGKSRNTAKRILSAQRRKTSPEGEYNLSYFNLWWSRMAVEGRKEAKESVRIVNEEMQSRKTKKWKARRETKSAGKLTESIGGDISNNWMGLERGGGTLKQCNTWMAPSLGRKILERDRADTTDEGIVD